MEQEKSGIRQPRGVLFDTNRTLMPGGGLDMLRGGKVSAYGGKVRELDCFAPGDLVFYYLAGRGVVGAGRVLSAVREEGTFEGDPEVRLPVERLAPVQLPRREEDLQAVSAARLKELLGHGFYYAATVKRPFLTEVECELLLGELSSCEATKG